MIRYFIIGKAWPLIRVSIKVWNTSLDSSPNKKTKEENESVIGVGPKKM